MLGKKLFGEIMKRTFYGQFVAGPVFSFSMSNIHDNNHDDDMQTIKPGHRGNHSNDRPDAQLWREEHPRLQRGGGHQPGGGGTERDGVRGS